MCLGNFFWVLLLVYMGPRATHFTGYCWFMWRLGQHTLWVLLLVYVGIVVGYVSPRATRRTGYCYWFMRGLGQHTLLGYCCGLCEVSGNTLYWAS
jgi:hypothetical protein